VLFYYGGGGGATRPLLKDGGVEELHGDPTVRPRPKVWTRGQKQKKWCWRWRAGEARMRDSQGGGESDPAEGVHRRCMKNFPSVLSCIGKRTKEGCDCTNVSPPQRGDAVPAPLSVREVGRNGDTTTPRSPTIQSPPIVSSTIVLLLLFWY